MHATIRRTAALGMLLALLLSSGALPQPAAAQTAATRGSISVRVYNCPAGMRPETMVGDFCGDLVTRGFQLVLKTPTGAKLTLADARRDGGVVTWSRLPFGTYTLSETRLPAGHDAYVVNGPTPGPGRIALRRSAPRVDAAVYNFKPAPAPATLTIHIRLCPTGYAGSDFYPDCHGTPAPAGLEFTATGPTTATAATDASGNATFTLAPGTYEVRGGVPGDFARLNLFCAPASAPGTPFPFTPLLGGVRGPNDPTGLRLALAAGDAVVCDWYNTPESQG